MSIATQITRLQNIKAAIRQALVNKGITAASTHDMDDFATDIGSIPTGGTYQSKTVSPSTSQQTVTPDSGYDALSQVTVNAMNLQNKSESITVPFSRSFTTTPVTISPDNGYDGMETTSVTMPQLVEYQLISTIWIRPTHQVYDDTTRIYFEEAETICGIYISRSGWSNKTSLYAIRANPAFGDATPADVRSGKTFTSGSGFALVGTGNF